MNGKRHASPATHQVIVNDQHQFVVWPTQRRLPLGWRYVGREGTRAELGFYLKQMAVETVPQPLLVTGMPAPDTRW